jgi:hypothetical protein
MAYNLCAKITGICESSYVRSLVQKSLETKTWNSQPLPEDIHLRSLTALKLEHASLRFDINKLNNDMSFFDQV